MSTKLSSINVNAKSKFTNVKESVDNRSLCPHPKVIRLLYLTG